MSDFTGKTHIVMVLDRSGSMASCWDETINGINVWKLETLAVPGDYTFSLTVFDTRIEQPHFDVALQDVPDFTGTEFPPRGSTALYDAVAASVTELEDKIGQDDRALVVIVTDGQENSSRRWTKEKVRDLVERLTDTGRWTFTYLSASPSAWSDAQVIGVAAGNTSTYTATPVGTQSAWSTVAGSTQAYLRSGGLTSTDFYAGPTGRPPGGAVAPPVRRLTVPPAPDSGDQSTAASPPQSHSSARSRR